MMDPMAVVDDFSREATESITIKNPATGEDITFLGKRFVDVLSYVAVTKKQKGRSDALKTSKNHLAVTIPTSVAEKYPESFKDAKPLVDGKSEIYLASDEEIQLATTIEMGLVEPALTWAEAVIWTRTVFPLCSTLSTELNKINEESAVERAKNDSGETNGTQDSPDSA